MIKEPKWRIRIYLKLPQLRNDQFMLCSVIAYFDRLTNCLLMAQTLRNSYIYEFISWQPKFIIIKWPTIFASVAANAKLFGQWAVIKKKKWVCTSIDCLEIFFSSYKSLYNQQLQPYISPFNGQKLMVFMKISRMWRLSGKAPFQFYTFGSKINADLQFCCNGPYTKF